MPNIYYIADWHYGHTNILAYDNRPFANIEQMDDALIRRWNSVVRFDDTVYVLGDMFWIGARESIDILHQLNGAKILIKGNHDKTEYKSFRSEFVTLADYMEIKDGDRNVVLCHYPIPCFKNHYHGWYHLYGHVHDSFEAKLMEHNRLLLRNLYQKECLMYNVGVMMPWMDYTPRTLDEIVKGAAAYQKNIHEPQES